MELVVDLCLPSRRSPLEAGFLARLSKHWIEPLRAPVYMVFYVNVKELDTREETTYFELMYGQDIAPRR